MKRWILIFCCWAFVLAGFAEGVCYYRVSFTDKANSMYTLASPSEYLSPRAIARRQKYAIAIDSADLPVNASYLQSLDSLGVTLFHTSRWMNTALVYGNKKAYSAILELPFVAHVELVGLSDTKKRTVKEKQHRRRRVFSSKAEAEPVFEIADFNYGQADAPISLMQGKGLHYRGFQGQGITIAVIDAGFTQVDVSPAFQHLWHTHRILDQCNLWLEDPASFYKTTETHGAAVLSTMGAYLPGQIIGTAPFANYILLQSEVSEFEQPIEQDLWVAAAEYADSLGVDVINTSLGYTKFDPPFSSLHYAQLNGKTAFMSIAASVASAKGIFVVISAGNEGRSKWYHIGVPADADGVISVAATDYQGALASFSSRGTSYDGRLKPEIATMGARVSCFVGNKVKVYDGTSFSSPIFAGMIACLIQAFPNASPEEIKQAVFSTASCAHEPNIEYGHGIPNFEAAYRSLEQQQHKEE